MASVFITSYNDLSVISSADVSFCLFITSCNGLSVISADVSVLSVHYFMQCSLLHAMASQLLVLMSVLSVHHFM